MCFKWQTTFFDFAKTLSLCFEFWVFSLSYWVFSWILSKIAHFPLKYWPFFNITLCNVDLVFSAYYCHYILFFLIFPFTWVKVCCYFFQILPKPWVLSYFLEAWVFSSSSLFSNGPKKAWLNNNFKMEVSDWMFSLRTSTIDKHIFYTSRQGNKEKLYRLSQEQRIHTIGGGRYMDNGWASESMYTIPSTAKASRKKPPVFSIFAFCAFRLQCSVHNKAPMCQ